jgi:catechol 2,3-dioxygenase-like lactoylglutathione lyase family enzyme
MPVTGLAHYNLRSNRETMEVLRDFYVEVVGLQPGYRPPFSSFGYWLYAGGQAVLHLSEARADEVRTAGAVNTFDHVAFSCADVVEFESRLRALHISFRSAQVPLTGERQIFFADPAGNGVELNFPAKEG